MFRHVLAPVDQAAEQRVLAETRALHRATTESRDATLAAARKLRATLAELLPKVAAYNYDAASLDVILASFVADGKRGEFRDFSSAEQVAMASQSLVVAFENAGKLDKDKAARLHTKLDALYDTVKDENNYAMTRFDGALQDLRTAAP